MAMTLMIENINNDFSSYSSGRSTITNNGSYYKFYQSKLRQLITQTRHRKEHEARIARQKQSKNPPVDDNRISDQRLHKEYMNHIRERSKMQTQEILSSRTDEPKKRSDSVLSSSIRTVTLSITSTNISTSMEYRPKIILKTKQTPVPPKQPRIISAPTSSQINFNRPKIIPTIKIDCIDDSLSTANIHSFTQASSSSSRIVNDTNSQHARKSILDTIMLHINSHIPSNIAQCPTYDDIDNKFSSSIAPTVYRNFERNVA